MAYTFSVPASPHIQRSQGISEVQVIVPDAIVLKGNSLDDFSNQWEDYFTSQRIPFNRLPRDVQDYFIQYYFNQFGAHPGDVDTQIYLLPANGKTYEQIDSENYFSGWWYDSLVNINGVDYFVILPTA